ncbi:MAG TPA: T9SS type A sorting domain-containing protein [Flavipsychrobacter sp.]|nr:T9SS type A sorting domain-containing protein [Flavipsychrobacter sp.]
MKNYYLLSDRVYFNVLCLIAFIFSATTLNAQAPALNWEKTYGGTFGDIGNCIQTTANNGYIIAGLTASSDKDVTGFHGGAGDAWVINLKDSNIVWEEALGGSGSDVALSIAATTDGGYIMAGSTNSTDGDVSGLHSPISGTDDMWIVKLSSTGAIIWQKCLGGSNNEEAYSIIQTSDGGYIVAGQTNSTDGDVTGLHGSAGGSLDIWVVKLDDTGGIMWQKCYGGSNGEVANSIVQTTDGGYIIAGSTNSTDGDVTGNHSGTTSDYWVVKINSTGNITWEKCFGGTDGDQANSIVQTTDGGYIVAGSTNSTDGDVTGNHGVSDTWIVKTNDTGAISWERCYGGTGADFANSIQQTSDGGYIVAGTTTSLDGDVHGNHGNYDYWVIKLMPNDSLEWQKCLGGSFTDQANSIIQNSDGSYAVTGFTESVDGEVTGYHDSTFGTDDGDVWVVKLNKDTPTYVTSINAEQQIQVYPTMSNGIVHVNIPVGYEQAQIKLINILGQSMSISENNEGITRTIRPVNTLLGLYILQIRNNGRINNYKIVFCSNK